jgi:flagellar biosynthesis protein
VAEKQPPRRRAAALRYEQGTDAAPRLVAKGQGLMAERILAEAREHGVPVHQNRALVDVLSRLDLDQQIPVEFYLVVAEILAFISRAQAAAKQPATPGR